MKTFTIDEAQSLLPVLESLLKRAIEGKRAAQEVEAMLRTKDPLYSKTRLAATQNINLQGNRISTDSFDSSDPLYSTGGRYDPAKSKDNSDVVISGSGIIAANNAKIRGRLRTGPGGVAILHAYGAVGDAAWVQGSVGIEPGWLANNLNAVWPDVAL